MKQHLFIFISSRVEILELPKEKCHRNIRE